MSNLASVAYEVLLAYVMPGAVVQLPFWLFARVNLEMEQADINTTGYVLVFFGFSIVLGFVINALATVVCTSELVEDRKRLQLLSQNVMRKQILFKDDQGKETLLRKQLKEPMEPFGPIIGDEKRIQFVNAVFYAQVPEYVYARRNWDWYVYQSSRNLLFSLVLFWPLLLIIALSDVLSGGTSTWSWNGFALGIVVAFGTILVMVILSLFSRRQLENYYGYYRDVALGYWLKPTADTVRQEPNG